MMITLIGCVLMFCLSKAASTTLDPSRLVVVIITQKTQYHSDLAKSLKENIIQQAVSDGYHGKPYVTMVPQDIPHVGSWTVIPVLDRLNNLNRNNVSWVFFCEDRTVVDLPQLLNGLSKYHHFEHIWLGHGVYDEEPTIIHHFAFAENPKHFKYPLFASGFAMSSALLYKLATSLPREDNRVEFSTDASHELALYVGIPLISVPSLFCVNQKDGCGSYPNVYKHCGSPIPIEDVFVAVKTCQKFHGSRVPVIKKTWANQVKYIEFYSDVKDSNIPTTSVGIRNMERGHCAKTLKILSMVLEKIKTTLPLIKWVILADDDTLLSVPRLLELLTCFKNDSIVGERYGYNVRYTFGYNYITGGGGMAFGVAALKKVVEKCTCFGADYPDDMMIGMCAANHDIPLVHSPLFHQARPMDYASSYLKIQEPVSFHKHWMVDPISIYKEWFSEVDMHTL